MYHYDLSGNLISETTATGAPQKDYVYLNSVPVAQIATDGSTDTISYLHTDHLGTPRQATNPAGEVVWNWDSDAFGTTAGNDDPDNDGTAAIINLRFAGQYYDAETALHYNYHRYYDPSAGRYVTSDPIGLEGGLNTYGYVSANPINYFDPYGLAQVEQIKYEIEIFTVSQPVDKFASMEQNENYKIYVNVDDRCTRKVKAKFSGWYGPLKGAPSLSFGDDSAFPSGKLSFSRKRFIAVIYEFEGCGCETEFSREEYNDYKLRNWFLDIIRKFK